MSEPVYIVTESLGGPANELNSVNDVQVFVSREGAEKYARRVAHMGGAKVYALTLLATFEDPKP